MVLVKGEHVVASESHLDSFAALHPDHGKGSVSCFSGGAAGVLSDSPVHVVGVNVSETHDHHNNHVSHAEIHPGHHVDFSHASDHGEELGDGKNDVDAHGPVAAVSAEQVVIVGGGSCLTDIRVGNDGGVPVLPSSRLNDNHDRNHEVGNVGHHVIHAHVLVHVIIHVHVTTIINGVRLRRVNGLARRIVGHEVT